MPPPEPGVEWCRLSEVQLGPAAWAVATAAERNHLPAVCPPPPLPGAILGRRRRSASPSPSPAASPPPVMGLDGGPEHGCSFPERAPHLLPTPRPGWGPHWGPSRWPRPAPREAPNPHFPCQPCPRKARCKDKRQGLFCFSPPLFKGLTCFLPIKVI